MYEIAHPDLLGRSRQKPPHLREEIVGDRTKLHNGVGIKYVELQYTVYVHRTGGEIIYGGRPSAYDKATGVRVHIHGRLDRGGRVLWLNRWSSREASAQIRS